MFSTSIDLTVFDLLVTAAYKIGTGESSPQDFATCFSAMYPDIITSILGYDQVRPGEDIFAATIDDSSMLNSWIEHYAGISPYVRPVLMAPPLTMVRGTDYLSDEELHKTEYYNDFLRPAGDLSQGFGVTVFKEKDRFLVWSAIFAPLNAAEGSKAENAMRLLTPHVRRSFELARQLQNQSSLAKSLESVLNGFSSAVFICKSDMSITFANQAAETELLSGTVVSARQNRLRFSASTAHISVQEKVRCFATEDFGGASMQNELFTPVGSVQASPRLAFISPLPEGDTTGRTVFRTSLERPVLVMLINPDHGAPVAEELIRTVFGVTPAEAKLASALATGMSPGEYADGKGISRNTVRVQTQALLNKMGVRRQSDITRLITAAFSQLHDGFQR